ncbi:MAG: sugar phosphate isomerase/epimerase, partial [Eubacteriales bacterium]|nr:sugar phosphate isomerase/epimerase [Eubacteriales bacterium]
MKLGVFAVVLGGDTLEQACRKLEDMGVQAIEIGVGGYPGKAHCDPAEMLADEAKLNEFKATIERHNLTLSALSCHGNPVHPDKEKAAGFDQDIRNAILMAEKLGLDTIVTFSGCPGGSRSDKMPNWVTCPWPPDFIDVLDYQWNKVLIPYWKKMVKFAHEHGVSKIAFEMHPGFCVYNPETLLKLRKAVGPEIGANFDPSHLYWQGIDPVKAIRALKDCMWHFHAKDTKIDNINTPVNGVLDTKHYGDEINRSWLFRSVGYGHDMSDWKAMMSELRLIGYDGAISIEHEDSLMSNMEGLSKAVEFLKQVLIYEPVGEIFW